MSKALSLKLKDNIFNEVESIIKDTHMPRNAYINEALDFYNKLIKRKKMRLLLQRESKLVQANSMEILSELEELEDNIL